MLTLLRSPLPALPTGAEDLPGPALAFAQRTRKEPQRCLWIVPTSRRRRALVRDWLSAQGKTASFQPGFHTLESFVAEALTYSLRQRPSVSCPERLLRLARAWQDMLGRAAGTGLVRQLDRFVRDWQACGRDAPYLPVDLFERLAQRYLTDLEKDGQLDRMGSIRVLTAELADPESGPNRHFLSRYDTTLFDGFHRLERVELELVAALSHHCETLVWLTGSPGQLAWETVQSATSLLQERGATLAVYDVVGATPPALAALGRSLFPIEPARSRIDDPLPGLFRLEASCPAAEVEAVARRIKHIYRAAEATGKPFRLSEVAIVLPGPAYDPLIREIFPRTGLAFSLTGSALPVASSRPARVLTTALQLVRGQWRPEYLLDFLNQPLVRRHLRSGHRLYDLFEHRPRIRQQLGYPAWSDAWDRYLQSLRTKIAHWKAGTLDLLERTLLSREEFVERQTELADNFEELIDSIHTVLRPVAALIRLLDGPVRELVGACVELLGTLRIDLWLKPPTGLADAAVPWVEYERDQQAYDKLLGILERLAALPEKHLPRTPGGQPDALGAFLLALHSETYRVASEDGAGVQVFEAREVRGLRFRHVYVLGLVDGQVPAPPEEGVLADRRRSYRELDEQRRQKESEEAWLFSQFFEAASETLTLSRPLNDAGRQTLPSPFLAAVAKRVALPESPAVALVAGVRDAASRLGRAGAHLPVSGRRLTDLWPGVAVEQATVLDPLLAMLAAHQERDGWPRRLRVDAPALLRHHFPDEYAFSPSELETYAACSFRYFGSRVLRLSEREPDPTRIYYGSLVHRVLQTFYEERRRALNDDQPLPPISAAHRARLLELFQQEWSQLEDGTLPPDLEYLFRCDGGVIDLFFELMQLIERDSDYGNVLAEFEIPRVLLGQDDGGQPVYLTGKVDRVDVSRKSCEQAIILDYKTGRNHGTTERKVKLADGRWLQLQLYALALERLRGLRVIGGAYLHLNEKQDGAAEKAVALVGLSGGLVPGDGEPDVPFDLPAARQKALQFAGAIRSGAFSLTLHAEGEYTECTAFCSLRHACRHPDGYKTFGF
jgi:hypothetical protein